MLRHPVSRFISDIQWFDRVKNPDEYIISNGTKLRRNANLMIADLGRHESKFSNEDEVKAYIEYLDGAFDLVMIAEYFDESLILLKHLFCWNTDDIVYAKLNLFSTTKEERKLTSKAHDIFKAKTVYDHMLYAYFLEKFQNKIKTFGEDKMSLEVAELREKCDKLKAICIEKTGLIGSLDRKKSIRHPNRDDVIVYQLKENVENSHCKRLFLQEKSYTDLLRRKTKQNSKKM